MKKITRVPLLAAAFVLCAVAIGAAHDMFLKPSRYFAPENTEVRIRVLNGTFTRSENSIARNRLADLSVVSPTRRSPLDTAEWGVVGDTSTFHIHTRGAGTYVVGVSTKPNALTMTGADFDLYLQEDGIPDVLAARKRAGQSADSVRERYAKHIKTLIQVGNARSDHYATVMGYPAELVPLENPYSLAVGGTLRVRALVDGKPVANQLVLYGGTNDKDAAVEQKSTRSNSEGVASIPLAHAGAVYVKFINMAAMRTEGLNYESKWATLTFQVR
ncbi:MAG: DUF4198 domain-containing protein [Gemmatimonadetes bacterium]|nr:DUF4198 domain-containing protein [Gemmatimonadota bacterium]